MLIHVNLILNMSRKSKQTIFIVFIYTNSLTRFSLGSESLPSLSRKVHSVVTDTLPKSPSSASNIHPQSHLGKMPNDHYFSARTFRESQQKFRLSPETDKNIPISSR